MKRQHITLTMFATLAAILLSGCSSNFAPNPVQPEQTTIGPIQGAVHGGQSPVSGAQIYLYAAGTGGYGTSATSLMTAGPNTFKDGSGNYYALTDANGNFSLGGDYTCTQGQQVYMVAVGGNPGLTPVPPATSINNTAIVQMAGLGQCPAAGNLAAQVPYLIINEVTTVAFAYAMGGFATNAYNISSSGTTVAQTGIANAMLNAGNIASLQYGAALAVANGNSKSIVPQSKIYTLADILATCVNTSSSSSTQCTALFAAAATVAPSGGSQPATDEANAIFNIVHNPTANVSTLFSLLPSSPVFQPYMSSAPTDWTLPVVYQGVVGTPVNIAFDTSGNAWLGDSTKGVVEIGPQGAVSTFTKNQSNQAFGAISGVAVASNGTIWATDLGSKLVYIMNSAGVVTTTISNGNLQNPAAVSFDSSGNAFVVNESAASISIFNSSGSTITGWCPNSCTVGGMNHPNWIAVDTSGNAWITSQTNDVGELPKTGGAYSNSNTNYKLKSNTGLAFDAGGNLWVVTTTPTELDELNSGTVINTVKKAGLSSPQTVAVDGAGNVWVSNAGAAVISGFSNSAAALYSAGLTTGSTGNTLAVTPDGSGNLWSANSDGTVSQLLGASTPVATPMVPGNYGVKP